MTDPDTRKLFVAGLSEGVSEIELRRIFEAAGASVEEVALRRIRTRAIVLGAVLSVAAFALDWRAGVSLTIAAGVVIFSLLVFEKLTERLVPPQEKRGFYALFPLLLVTAAGLVLLGIVFRWKGFQPIAGAAGLSVVVLAIAAEILGGKESPRS